MKKLTYFINSLSILAIIALIFYSCQQDTVPEIFEEEEYQKKIESYEAKIKELEEKVSQKRASRRRPDNIIPFYQAQKMFKNYDKRADQISALIGTSQDGAAFEPTRSLFYEISELKSYLSYIEKLSKKVDVTPSGIRFYFALYSDDYVSSDGSNDNAKRQTVFIAPTLKQSNGNHIGYTLDNNYKVKFLDDKTGFYHREKDRNKSAAVFAKNPNIDQFSLIANEFGSSPPIGLY